MTGPRSAANGRAKRSVSRWSRCQLSTATGTGQSSTRRPKLGCAAARTAIASGLDAAGIPRLGVAASSAPASTSCPRRIPAPAP